MELQVLPYPFTVCKLPPDAPLPLHRPFCFVGKTDEEISLVCDTGDMPEHTLAREDGWRAFRIQGVLDFSLVGILSRISGLLAEQHISIFALSTFNTDYVLVKEHQLPAALTALEKAGYSIC